MNDPSVVKQVMDLQDMPFPDLNVKYRELFGKEPPAANRKQVIARLDYRIQEIACDVLSEELKEMQEQTCPPIDVCQDIHPMVKILPAWRMVYVKPS